MYLLKISITQPILVKLLERKDKFVSIHISLLRQFNKINRTTMPSVRMESELEIVSTSTLDVEREMIYFSMTMLLT